MIIGKKDKKRFKQLQDTNNLLNDEYFQKMYRDDLLQLIKAIINKFQTKEIVITLQEIREAEEMQLYVEDEYLRHARKYKVINPIQLLQSFEEVNK